jgi:hypothetical protein
MEKVFLEINGTSIECGSYEEAIIKRQKFIESGVKEENTDIKVKSVLMEG